MNNSKVLSKVRSLILKHFGSWIDEDPARAKRIVEEATFTGKTDPGGWDRSATVVIHTESGIPNGLFDGPTSTMEKWVEISKEMGTHFCEHINGAVIGVYEA